MIINKPWKNCEIKRQIHEMRLRWPVYKSQSLDCASQMHVRRIQRDE